MGQVNFASFKSRLSLALGDRGVGSGPLGNWVNDGYFDMTGSHDFIELRTVATATLSAENDAVQIPDDLQWIRALLDVSGGNKLVKLASEHFHILEDEVDDDVEIRNYTRDGNAIYVRPTFSLDTTLTILYNREPKRLTNDSDVTVLPATYDKPLHQFAMYHALSDLGEEVRGQEWRNAGILYLRSRLDADDYEAAPGTHAGLRFPKSEAELTG